MVAQSTQPSAPLLSMVTPEGEPTMLWKLIQGVKHVATKGGTWAAAGLLLGGVAGGLAATIGGGALGVALASAGAAMCLTGALAPVGIPLMILGGVVGAASALSLGTGGVIAGALLGAKLAGVVGVAFGLAGAPKVVDESGQDMVANNERLHMRQQRIEAMNSQKMELEMKLRQMGQAPSPGLSMGVQQQAGRGVGG